MERETIFISARPATMLTAGARRSVAAKSRVDPSSLIVPPLNQNQPRSCRRVFCALFLLRGRRSGRTLAGIAFVSLGTLLAAIAFFAFFALRSLGTCGAWIALRTFKTSRESERCNERSYQSQEPHASSFL
jgi:hypothetical protein